MVVLVVPSSTEVAQCLDGPEGVLAQDRPGQILLDFTTSDPERTKQLARIAAARGRAYLDAGMSGGAVAADAGRLTLMVGGERQSFERCRPLFEAIADMSRVRLVGPSGAGHTMKLVHNMICHTIFMATAEGCRVAERAGIDLTTAVEVINSGNARSFVSEQRFPNHILSGTWDGRSTVSNLEKDLRMGVEMAGRLGAPVSFSAGTAALLARALEAGMSEADFTLIYKEFDRLAR
jgi:3-hydroxyisobutyrate dehydrogenase